MQLQIDLTGQPATYGKAVIAAIEAYYGLDCSETKSVHTLTVSVEADVSKALSEVEKLTKAAGTAQSAFPLPVALSTAAADPSSTAPVVPPVTSAAPIVPPVPALPTAPVATVQTEPAAPTNPASGVAVDKTGLPWDARIHSSSKAVNADGTWRKRKGLNDDAFVKRIEDELRAVMAVVVDDNTLATVQMATVTMFNDPPGSEPEIRQVSVVMPVNDVLLPPLQSIVPPPPPVPVADPTTLPELMPRVTEKMIAGLIPNDALITAVNQCELPDLPSLAHRPDMIPKVWAQLKANCPGVW